MLKILTCTDFLFPNYLGGSARFASDLIDGLVENGCDVVSVTRPRKGEYSGWGEIRPLKIIETRNIFKLIFLIFNKYDFVISHHPIFGLLPAIFQAQKLIYFYHGPFAEEFYAKSRQRGFGYFLRKLIEVFVLYRCKKIIVVSDFMLQKIKKYDRKIINLGPIQKLRPDISTLNVSEEKRRQFNCLTVRRLTARTGVLELLRMVSENPSISLTVIGSGELREKLMDNFSNIAEFHTAVSDDVLAEMYKTADIVILPSIELEGFGLIILEALAHGTPIIASTTSGGACEFLEKIGIKTFLDMQLDSGDDLSKKVSDVIEEYQKASVIKEISNSFQKSYYITYAKDLIDVLRS